MPFLRRWIIVFLTALTLIMAWASSAQAQGITLPGLNNGSDQQQAGQDPKAVRQSLDQVIATLESDAQRGELLEKLKQLREATSLSAGEDKAEHGGLLGALADSFNDYGKQAEAGNTPLDIWAQRSQRAGQEVESLLHSTSRTELLRVAIEAVVLVGIWLGLLLLLIGAGRLLARRYHWPHRLPPEPRFGLLAVHFLRKVLPWALAFAVMLVSLNWLDAPLGAPRASVLVLAYITLCGRLLSTVFDVVISAFTRGHRRVAVALLRQEALSRLFVIGALAALGDAVDSEQLVALMGSELSSWLSVACNVLAGLISGRLVLRIKRPVKHLIRNRPYAQRRQKGAVRDLVNVLARLWHVPALLLIGASLVAIFVTGGEAEDAFTRAIICAALLVFALVAVGVLRRQSEKAEARRRLTQYRRRLIRFGYTLAHFVVWIVFAELGLRVWGISLLGIGGEGALSVRIGQALLGVGLTIMLAWLLWIFLDTAIQRALNTSARIRGRRAYNTRAQTITPMIRNVVFITIVVIASIVGLANLGVNVTPLLAGAGVIGLAIGFGAQTLVQDLITGLFILIEDSLSIDDFVDVGGHMGTVERLSLRTVRLRDLDGIVHIIPFSHIKGIKNYSREFGIALIRIRVPHDMLVDDAITLVREVSEELRRDPMMRHHIWSSLELQGIESFDQGAAVLRMRLRTGPIMQWDVARAFNLKLKQRLEKDGLDLAMPRMAVVMQDEPGQPDMQSWKPTSRRAANVGHSGPASGEAGA